MQSTSTTSGSASCNAGCIIRKPLKSGPSQVHLAQLYQIVVSWFSEFAARYLPPIRGLEQTARQLCLTISQLLSCVEVTSTVMTRFGVNKSISEDKTSDATILHLALVDTFALYTVRFETSHWCYVIMSVFSAAGFLPNVPVRLVPNQNTRTSLMRCAFCCAAQCCSFSCASSCALCCKCAALCLRCACAVLYCAVLCSALCGAWRCAVLCTVLYRALWCAVM